MHSRTILLGGIVGLACLILIGMAGLNAAAPSDSNPPPAFGEEVSDARPSDTDRMSASSRRAVADTLRRLLNRAQVAAASDTLRVTGETVPIYARMIRVIDRHDEYDIRFAVMDPSEATAYRSAEVLRNALLLNVKHPERLDISSDRGSRAVLVEVSKRITVQ